MQTPRTGPDSLSARLDALETQNRSLRRILVALGATLLAAASLAFAAPQQETLRAQRLLLTDADGTPRAELLTDDGRLAFRLLPDATPASADFRRFGPPASSLLLGPEGVLLVDADGTVIGRLGRAMPHRVAE